MKASEFFTLPASLAPFAAHFRGDVPPWEWLANIGAALSEWGFDLVKPTGIPPGVHIEGQVYLHPAVQLPPYAVIVGPAWIGPGCQIRPGAFIRGLVIAGANCVLGHACEYKNCLLMDGVATPHYNYVGDSILGNKAHLGAGVICSNFRLDGQNIVVRGPDSVHETGLRKLGAILGDSAEVGCNAVLNPGTVLGPRSLVMPTLAFSGYLPPDMIAKGRQTVTHLRRKN